MTTVVSRIVEVCVFRFTGNAIEYLLLKRAQEDPLYPGIWQWVTGAILEGEKALDAAFREFREETSMRGERAWIVPHVTSFYDASHDCVHCCPLIAVQVAPGTEPVLSKEHEDYRWASHAEARRWLVWPGQRQGLDMVQQVIAAGEEGAGLLEMKLG